VFKGLNLMEYSMNSGHHNVWNNKMLNENRFLMLLISCRQYCISG